MNEILDVGIVLERMENQLSAATPSKNERVVRHIFVDDGNAGRHHHIVAQMGRPGNNGVGHQNNVVAQDRIFVAVPTDSYALVDHQVFAIHAVSQYNLGCVIEEKNARQFYLVKQGAAMQRLVEAVQSILEPVVVSDISFEKHARKKIQVNRVLHDMPRVRLAAGAHEHRRSRGQIFKPGVNFFRHQSQSGDVTLYGAVARTYIG